MTAHDQMKAMLDQLMGTGRNGENNRYQVKFTDSKVCKSFLLACCPHEILSSTRMDLGECPKIHDLALRADYEQASKKRDYYYDIDAMEHLQSFIADCDHRTDLAKQRLLETQEVLSAEVAAKANKVHELAEQIGKKLAKAEMLGAEGLVDDSMKLMEEIEDLRKKKAAAELEYRNSMPASSYQQQKLRVCEVCSAYLGIHDNDRRLADHFGGKLHLGFIKIREKLAQLQATVEERKNQRRNEGKDRDRERERDDRDRVKERDRDRDRDRERDRGDRDRERDRDRDRDRETHRERDRERERDRDRDRDRDRERDRDRRDRDRDRERDRDRDRDRERTKRSPSDSRSDSGRTKRRKTRSRSKSRSHRSRSRSRSRLSHSSRRRSRDRERDRDNDSRRSSSRSGKQKERREDRKDKRDEGDLSKSIGTESKAEVPLKSEETANGSKGSHPVSNIPEKSALDGGEDTSEKEEGELGDCKSE